MQCGHRYYSNTTRNRLNVSGTQNWVKHLVSNHVQATLYMRHHIYYTNKGVVKNIDLYVSYLFPLLKKRLIQYFSILTVNEDWW